MLSYGGFPGIGGDHDPTPRSGLKDDARLGGCVVGIAADQLNGAPKYSNDNDWAWSRENDQRV